MKFGNRKFPLTSFSCAECNRWTWRAFVSGVQDSNLRRDIGERPEVIDVAEACLPLVTAVDWQEPAGTWFPIDDAVLPDR